MNISELLGKTLTKVDVGSDEIVFFTTCGRVFSMSHHQDCCESVSIEDIAGDTKDLIGHPITMAEESSGDKRYREPLEQITDRLKGVQPEESSESQTWTFYKLATIKGYVDIRWYGTSNGYYSESADFEELK